MFFVKIEVIIQENPKNIFRKIAIVTKQKQNGSKPTRDFESGIIHDWKWKHQLCNHLHNKTYLVVTHSLVMIYSIGYSPMKWWLRRPAFKETLAAIDEGS